MVGDEATGGKVENGAGSGGGGYDRNRTSSISEQRRPSINATAERNWLTESNRGDVNRKNSLVRVEGIMKWERRLLLGNRVI